MHGSFSEDVRKDLRLIMLRALEQDPGYDLNESILHSIVGQFGHNVTRDQIRTEVAWLQEQGFVSTKDVVGCLVATLTERGADVATGRAVVPGVKRPSPKG
jgi:hypothetical protein